MNSCKAHQITALSLLLLIAAAYIIMALWFPFAYLIGTYEDLVGEWSQFFFFASAAMYGFRLVLAKSPYRLFFGLLALACALAALEEISWGQRLFDIASPEIMRLHNLQKEINVHNLIIGPIETTSKVVIYRLVALGLILYGFAFPMALAVNWKPALRIEKLGIPAPPLYLWPFFVISAILQLELYYFNEAEVAEIILPFGLAIFSLQYLVAHQQELPARQTGTWPARVSKHLAFRIMLIFAWVLSLSVAATYGVYASPRLEKITHERLMKGVNSFAKRYKRYDLWGPSITLYQKALEEKPTNTSIMRNLALCYDRIGMEDKRDFYLDRAVEIGMIRYIKKPDSIKANLSLALTYRQKEDAKKSTFHFYKALVNARKNAEKKPRSASAAYRLGQTYVLMKQYGNALPYLEKALKLQPNSTKYGKAVRKVRAKVRR